MEFFRVCFVLSYFIIDIVVVIVIFFFVLCFKDPSSSFLLFLYSFSRLETGRNINVYIYHRVVCRIELLGKLFTLV